MNNIGRIYGVGMLRKSGHWEVRAVKIHLDAGNKFRPVWPLTLSWFDGINAAFFKETPNGRVFYKEI